MEKSVFINSEGNVNDDTYHQTITEMNDFFNDIAASHPLFEAEVGSDMFYTYLSIFSDADERQHHNCHACRDFLRNYGAVVYVDTDGNTRSAVFGAVVSASQYTGIFAAMREIIDGSKIKRPFVTKDRTLGKPVTGKWAHFALDMPVPYTGVLSASQRAAEIRDNFVNIQRALNEFSVDVVRTALSLLESDNLYRSEKVLGPVRFLHDLHMLSGPNKRNLMWKAVASAPDGFCHPRASMAGVLLEDIANGVPYDTYASRFKAMMEPTKYRRPVSDPSDINIDEAERLIKKLNIEKSLERRFASAADVPLVWKPTAVVCKSMGVFDDLRKKKKQAVKIDRPTKITYEKFKRTVMGTALSMSYNVIPGRRVYAQLATAVHQDSPCLFQWGTHLSWYVYKNGSNPYDFNLSAGHDVDVIGVVELPWNSLSNYRKQCVFLLRDCRDLNNDSLALFPETLKSDLHGIRKVIEAYSRSRALAPAEGGPAVAGIVIPSDAVISITVNNGTTFGVYHIDRWD